MSNITSNVSEKEKEIEKASVAESAKVSGTEKDKLDIESND